MNAYKGYTASVDYDPTARALHGRVDDIQAVISFEAQGVEELEQRFHEAIDDYIAWCSERGVQPEKTFSGNFVVRLDPALHRAITLKARRAGKPLNAWVTQALECAADNIPFFSDPNDWLDVMRVHGFGHSEGRSATGHRAATPHPYMHLMKDQA